MNNPGISDLYSSIANANIQLSKLKLVHVAFEIIRQIYITKNEV